MRFFERHKERLTKEMIDVNGFDGMSASFNPRHLIACPPEYIAYICDKILYEHFAKKMHGKDRRVLDGLMNLLFSEDMDMRDLEVREEVTPFGKMSRMLFAINLHQTRKTDPREFLLDARDLGTAMSQQPIPKPKEKIKPKKEPVKVKTPREVAIDDLLELK